MPDASTTGPSVTGTPQGGSLPRPSLETRLASLLPRARGLEAGLVTLRRDLHRQPELGFREHRTGARIVEALAPLPLALRTGVARTGVVADLAVGGGGAEAPLIVLRADMDALPIQEENTHGFVSEVPGVMHACGHDAHMAGLVGAIQLLVALDADGHLPPGRLRFLFQPSEEGMDAEGWSGGRRMAHEGLVDGAVGVVGLHVAAHLEAGTVHLVPGPFFAGADTLEIIVEGRAAHAARPHEGVDALVLAAQGILAAQQAVSRGIAPERRGVVSLGTIAGGDAHNIVCDRVRITGTIRYFEPEVREALHRGVAQAFRALEVQGARVRVEVTEGYPPVVNDPAMTARVREVAAAVAGPGSLAADAEPAMTAEDFSFLAARAPGAFFWLGAGLPEPDRREHHHPRFDVDESVLPLGAALLAGAALRLLHDQSETP